MSLIPDNRIIWTLNPLCACEMTAVSMETVSLYRPRPITWDILRASLTIYRAAYLTMKGLCHKRNTHRVIRTIFSLKPTGH